MQSLPLRLTAALAFLAATGAATGASRAQTASPPVVQDTPSPTTPNAITPPNGVARGVIRPSRPVDPDMVTRPPTRGQHRMPVIKPPGTAR